MITPISECLYCQNNQTLHSLMIKICDLKVSQLFLFKEQSHPGRCVVAYNEHGIDFHQLTANQRDAFMADVAAVGNAIEKAYCPAKINYGMYSDTLSHLHMHIVPKYTGGFEFGGVFEMNPKKTYLTNDEYINAIDKIKTQIELMAQSI